MELLAALAGALTAAEIIADLKSTLQTLPISWPRMFFTILLASCRHRFEKHWGAMSLKSIHGGKGKPPASAAQMAAVEFKSVTRLVGMPQVEREKAVRSVVNTVIPAVPHES
jgi:hypothetical protein